MNVAITGEKDGGEQYSDGVVSLLDYAQGRHLDASVTLLGRFTFVLAPFGASMCRKIRIFESCFRALPNTTQEKNRCSPVGNKKDCQRECRTATIQRLCGCNAFATARHTAENQWEMCTFEKYRSCLKYSGA